ncbi:hypothetical protein [Staphylothermus hellenicus]|uniref:Uncharacterized protein n=1 Tax=Staphylothermus hellenicus (strain DSM 12710 / JCM 10830 / BK20S6-10-b1 / P8) TaxID=591019 RepID=D7DA53_STAHD|nr:hypothetical protein [Staphylothermus hellenicus]ADI32649.1 hypothetical protein Shell_1561 [Staphylothermus hellenicus DSM 12710]
MNNKIFSLETIEKGFYMINYLGKTIYFHIFSCKKSRENIDEEIDRLKLDNKTVYALIPVNTIQSINQLIQGVLHYYIYEKTYTRIRNKGLLLSMFILGQKQLRDTINKINNGFSSSKNYYLIIIGDQKTSIRDKCVPTDLVFDLRDDDFKVLAKNIQSVLETL